VERGAVVTAHVDGGADVTLPSAPWRFSGAVDHSPHELGSFGADVCSYGGTFCDSPVIVFTGAALAAAWGMFVSIK